MAVVYGVETAAEQAKAHRFIEEGSGSCEGNPLSGLSEENQVVSVNDFLVFLWPDLLLDVLRLQPFHSGQKVGREIDEAFSEFFPVGVQTTHRIARFKLPGDVNDPRCE